MYSSGNQYEAVREVGLHYQIHRGIGVHHARALRRGVPFRVNVVVGGPPALALAAVMPLPEGMPELAFAGMLGGRRVRLVGRPPSPPPPRGGGGVTGFCRCRPRRISSSPALSIRRASCRKGRSATTSAITASPTTSRC